MNIQHTSATAPTALAFQLFNEVTHDWPLDVRRALCDADTAEALAIVADEAHLSDADKALIEYIERVSMQCCAARLSREECMQ